MKKSVWITYFVVFIAMGMLMRKGCQPEPPEPVPARAVVVLRAPVPEGNPAVADVSMELRLQIADTKETRAAGLQNYPGLPGIDSSDRPVHGLVYVYPTATTATFYEASTPMALSTAAIADDGTILEIHHTAAQASEPVALVNAVRFVVQVRRGWFADRGLGAGDKLELPPDLVARLAPPSPSEGTEEDTPVQADTEVTA